MTQETLEEVAERLYPENWESIMDGQHDSNSYERTAFINGAKWQQERMYSEEEVDNLCELIKQNERKWDLFDKNIIKIKPKSYYEIIEQFKKK